MTAGTGGNTSTVTMPVAAGGSGGSMSMAGSAAPLAGMNGSMSGAGGSTAMAGAAGNAQAGMGGMAGSAAGMGGSAGMAGMMMMDAGSGDGMADCGTGGTVGKASNDGGGSGRGNGNVQFTVSASNQIVSLRTTLEVPVKPNGTTTFFIWPGLEPIQGSPHYSPIGTGVLQPVLTWGGSCAPGSPQTRTGTSWWISAQYVNTLGSQPGFTGCHGGDVMNVEIGDKLLIEMTLDGAVWNQTVTDQATGKKVDFDFDLMMQEQRWGLFQIEMPTSTKPASDIVFTDTVITLAKSEPKACQPTVRGANDYYSAPVSSSDGLRCCVSRLVLRAAGVPATTTDPAP